jgi:excisionase family DNA binding protein
MERMPLVYTVDEACEVARTGKTLLYAAIKSGVLPAYKRGRRTLLRPDDLRHWVDGLSPINPQSKPRKTNQNHLHKTGAAK